MPPRRAGDEPQDVLGAQFPFAVALLSSRKTQSRSQAWLVREVRRAALEDGEPNCGATRSAVSRWESGEVTPNPDSIRWIARALNLSVRYLSSLADLQRELKSGRPSTGRITVPGRTLPAPGDLASRYAQDGEADVNRREFLQLGTMGGISLAVDPERWTALVSGPCYFDGRTVDELHGLLRLLIRQWDSVNPRVLLPTLLHQVTLLQNAQPHRSIRMVRMLGESLVAVGWVSSLLNNYGDAAMYWKEATELATDYADGYVQGLTLAGRSALYSGIEHGGRGADPRRALDLLNSAEETADRSNPSLRSFVMARKAELYAALNDETSCQADLDGSQRILESTTEVDDGILHNFSSAQLVGFRGNCAVLLQRAPMAIDILSSALRNIPTPLVPQRAAMMADLAAAYAINDEVEQACAVLQESLTMSQAGGSDQRRERIIGIRQAYLTKGAESPAVKRLDEQLATL